MKIKIVLILKCLLSICFIDNSTCYGSDISYVYSDSSPETIYIEGMLVPTNGIAINGDFTVDITVYESISMNVVATYDSSVTVYNNFFRFDN